jgi:NitT/TauT family transport system substrate-binding protein
MDGIAPGEDFKAGAVAAAIVWAPVDEDCVKNVPGSHVVFNTRKATKAVSDIFITSDNYLQKNHDTLKKFVEGWLIAVGEINSNENAKREAAKILAASPMKVSVDEAISMIERTRLSTYGDNLQFFGLKPGGVTGEEMYTKMYRLYEKAGVVTKNIPSWRQISDSSLISSISLAGKEHDPEEGMKFAAPTAAEKTAPAFAEKPAPVQFAFGSAELTEEGKIAIDTYFASMVKEFGGVRVRIEGNTDNIGNAELNDKLSFARARSVARYLTTKYPSLDPNRFILIGNGFRKPVPGCENNATEECRARNRRTEFALLY